MLPSSTFSANRPPMILLLMKMGFTPLRRGIGGLPMCFEKSCLSGWGFDSSLFSTCLSGGRLIGHAALLYQALRAVLRHKSLQNALLRLVHFDEFHAKALSFRPPDDPQCDRDR